jgi:hypothetical protein
MCPLLVTTRHVVVSIVLVHSCLCALPFWVNYPWEAIDILVASTEYHPDMLTCTLSSVLPELGAQCHSNLRAAVDIISFRSLLF